MKTREYAGLCFSDERERQSFFNREIVVHQKLIRSVVSRILTNPDDIDDAIQECFLIAWMSLGSLKNRGAVISWLCTIARNTAVNMTRLDERKTVSLSEPVIGARHADGIVLGDSLVSSLPGPEDLVLMRDNHFQLQLAFEMLPMQYRQQLYLRCYLELEAAEINRLLGTDEHARRNACSRAKQAVRRNYERLEGIK